MKLNCLLPVFMFDTYSNCISSKYHSDELITDKFICAKCLYYDSKTKRDKAAIMNKIC